MPRSGPRDRLAEQFRQSFVADYTLLAQADNRKHVLLGKRWTRREHDIKVGPARSSKSLNHARLQRFNAWVQGASWESHLERIRAELRKLESSGE